MASLCETDSVELLRAVPATGGYDVDQPLAGSWTEGTLGAVVSVLPDGDALIEIVSERTGETVDLLKARPDSVRVCESARSLSS